MAGIRKKEWVPIDRYILVYARGGMAGENIHTYIHTTTRNKMDNATGFLLSRGGNGFVGYYGGQNRHIKSKPALKHGKEKRAKKVEKVGLVWLVVG